MSSNLTEQHSCDLSTCKWFSMECDQSVDNSSAAQPTVFVRIVFSDFNVREEFLTLLPPKTIKILVYVYNAMEH